MGRLLAILAFALTVVGCSDPAPGPIRVGSNIWPGYEPLYLAESLGAYPPEAVRLIEYPSTTEVIRAFRNKAIDVAALTMDEALLLRADGFDIKIILVMDVSAGADVIVGRPAIGRLEDIGKRPIGVEVTALGAFVLCRAAEVHGVDCRDLNVVDLKVNEHEQAYRSGGIDAAVTFEPVRTKLLEAGAAELFDSTEIPGEIVDVMVVRTSALEAHRRHLDTLIDGWFAAVDHMDAAPRAAARIMAARPGLTPEQFLALLDGLDIPDAAGNLALMRGDPPPLVATMGKLGAIMARHRLIADPPPTGADLPYPALVERVTQ